jgi:hypothetical protein
MVSLHVGFGPIVAQNAAGGKAKGARSDRNGGAKPLTGRTTCDRVRARIATPREEQPNVISTWFNVPSPDPRFSTGIEWIDLSAEEWQPFCYWEWEAIPLEEASD